MKRLVLLALTLGVLSLLPDSAEARRSCGQGRIYRVSMGICVSARSRLAYGYAGARRTIRHGRHHRLRFASRFQQEEEDQANERERRVRPKPPPGPTRHQPPMLQVIEAPPAVVEDPPVMEVPFAIQGSTLMRPPLKTFEWIKP
jgi:hypothetical protein